MNATEISMNQKNTERVDIIPILNKTKQMPAPFDYGDSVVNQYQLHYKGYFLTLTFIPKVRQSLLKCPVYNLKYAKRY